MIEIIVKRKKREKMIVKTGVDVCEREMSNMKAWIKGWFNCVDK